MSRKMSGSSSPGSVPYIFPWCRQHKPYLCHKASLEGISEAPVEGLGSHSGVLGKSPGGVCVMLRAALSLVREDSKDICLLGAAGGTELARGNLAVLSM